jgi:hypothetical protein
MLVSVPAVIRSEKLPNTRVEWYSYAKPFGENLLSHTFSKILKIKILWHDA